nr:dirigent protein 22-like [Tanacetum cinerariifolium]
MAQVDIKNKCTIFTIFLFSLLIAGESTKFSKNLPLESLGLKKEKLTHLHFYLHDTVSGDNPTAVPVARAPTTNTSQTLFGLTLVVDDPLTMGPEITSKLVGRAQGMYASASQNDFALSMALNFVFSEGKYNGSTFSLLARNPVLSNPREMSIVGGSGLFRFARGYVLAKTYFLDATTGDAIVEYDAYVLHYGD